LFAYGTDAIGFVAALFKLEANAVGALFCARNEPQGCSFCPQAGRGKPAGLIVIAGIYEVFYK